VLRVEISCLHLFLILVYLFTSFFSLVDEAGEKKTWYRIGWEWVHAWLGRIIFLMAAAQIVLGMMLNLRE
jgi:hypothetical protein